MKATIYLNLGFAYTENANYASARTALEQSIIASEEFIKNEAEAEMIKNQAQPQLSNNPMPGFKGWCAAYCNLGMLQEFQDGEKTLEKAMERLILPPNHMPYYCLLNTYVVELNNTEVSDGKKEIIKKIKTLKEKSDYIKENYTHPQPSAEKDVKTAFTQFSNKAEKILQDNNWYSDMDN